MIFVSNMLNDGKQNQVFSSQFASLERHESYWKKSERKANKKGRPYCQGALESVIVCLHSVGRAEGNAEVCVLTTSETEVPGVE